MNEQITHTPGPWFLGPASGSLQADSMHTFNGMPYRTYSTVSCKTRGEKVCYQKGVAFVDYCDGKTNRVAHCYQGEHDTTKPEMMFHPEGRQLQEQLMNCLLIAAAPELLEALKDAKQLLQLVEGNIPAKHEHLAEQTAAKMEKAINRATTIPEGVTVMPPEMPQYIKRLRDMREKRVSVWDSVNRKRRTLHRQEDGTWCGGPMVVANDEALRKHHGDEEDVSHYFRNHLKQSIPR
jgi:hypothetical protein